MKNVFLDSLIRNLCFLIRFFESVIQKSRFLIHWFESLIQISVSWFADSNQRIKKVVSWFTGSRINESKRLFLDSLVRINFEEKVVSWFFDSKQFIKSFGSWFIYRNRNSETESLVSNQLFLCQSLGCVQRIWLTSRSFTSFLSVERVSYIENWNFFCLVQAMETASPNHYNR